MNTESSEIRELFDLLHKYNKNQPSLGARLASEAALLADAIQPALSGERDAPPADIRGLDGLTRYLRTRIEN